MDEDGGNAPRRWREALLRARRGCAGDQAGSSPSWTDLHPVMGHLPAGLRKKAALGRAVDQDRIGIVDVDEDLALHGNVAEGRDGAAGAARAHMPHALSRLRTEPEADHLVVLPQRAVEQDDRRAGQALPQAVGHLRAAGNVEKPALARAYLHADRVARLACELIGRIACLEIERDLARNVEQLDREPACAAIDMTGLEHLTKRDRPAAPQTHAT